MKPKIQFITVKGVFKKNGKVLLLKDQSGRWELPGGRIDFGETPEQTLAREFKEELGIDNVSIGKLLNTWSFVSEREDSSRQFIVLVYICEALDQLFQKSEEHTEIGWFTQKEIESLDIRDGYKNSIALSY